MVRSTWDWQKEDAYQALLGLNIMTKQSTAKRQLVICIRTDDPDLLTPRRIYEVLPDPSAEKSHYLRIIDNEGEDYLYPVSYFVFVDLSPAVEEAVLQAS